MPARARWQAPSKPLALCMHGRLPVRGARSNHAMQIPLLLDRSRPESLTTQIVEQLRDTIRQGRVAAGARLPSSRKLADQLDVSRNTAVRAYELLILEGYVESRPASGIFAALELPERQRSPGPPPPIEADAPKPHPMPFPHLPARSPDLVQQNRMRLAFDFIPGRPNAGLFPLKTWRRYMQGCLSHGGAIGLSQYSDPAGLAVLRSAIAAHIAASRGILADVARIVVVSGIQEGISIAARLFLGPDTVGAIENPCYQGAAFAFEATGARVVSVPVDVAGIMPDELPRRRTSLLYVTPSHQYPTGHTLALSRRYELITWARRNGCYVLEDDYDADFHYDGSPLPAITSLAPDCTIYLGTFSKSLGAGLRLGYMVVPAPLADAARNAKALLDNGNPWLEQAVLAEMMRSGSFAAHIARVRARYKESRDTLMGSLRRHFGDIDVSGQESGLHVFWRLPPGVPDAPALEGLARRVRIGLYPLASGGAYDAGEAELSKRAIIMGYAALTPKQIEQGVARLSEAVDDALELPSSPLMRRLDGRSALHLAPNLLHQPALRIPARRRARSKWIDTTESGIPMPVVTGVYRYPIKGLSAQRVPGVVIEAGQPFPKDRTFALARPGSPIDPHAPKWAKKGLFVMLMLDEALASVETELDVDTLDFTIKQGKAQLLRANLDNENDRNHLEEFFRELVPILPGPPRLVAARGGHFMDKPDSVLSLINLATVRSLEEQWGVEIDPLRFRANFYIDGAQPWEEFDWIGSDIALGDALFRVDRRNGRCGATNVNPVTGRRDLDIPGSLRAAFGHKDLGVYLIARKTGEVSPGATVRAPRRVPLEGITRPLVQATVPTGRRFICRGCYFVYEEARGLPQQAIPPGTRFAMIPDDWVCPDCGTEKGNFRPHVQSEVRRVEARKHP
jgi:GntR family transcriptional regulator / MocR family aminotransferase